MVAGFLAALVGLLVNSATPKEAAEPVGVPVPALVAYLAGAGTLWLLRSGWENPG